MSRFLALRRIVPGVRVTPAGLGFGLFTFFLLWNAFRISPVNDEYGHFYAGCLGWDTGREDVFNVNPPVIRRLATLAHVFRPIPLGEIASRKDRFEFEAGMKMHCRFPDRFITNLRIGRMLITGFAIAGAWILSRYARELGGPTAANVACLLWMFQPQVIAHGSLITSDIPVATAMLFVCWMLERALANPSLPRFGVVGGALGVAISIKFTALIMLPVILLALAGQVGRTGPRTLIGGTFLVFVCPILLIGSVYGFQGFGRPLGSYVFVSGHFQAAAELLHRLSQFVLIPFPEHFILGLDRQQLDFEMGLISYAGGVTAHHGWWWFFPYSMAMKLPLGTIVAIVAAVALITARHSGLLAKLALPLSMLVAIMLVLVLKDGIGQQTRYCFPTYPFLFLVVAVASARQLGSKESMFRLWARRTIVAGTLGTVISTCWIAPRWMSSFNVFAGGYKNGYKTLFNDASDWGQDTFAIERWISSHPTCAPLYIRSHVSGRILCCHDASGRLQPAYGTELPLLRPGNLMYWFIVSKSDLVLSPQLMAALERQQLIAHIGGTHFVYRIRRPQIVEEEDDAM